MGELLSTVIDLCAVIVSTTEETPSFLVVRRAADRDAGAEAAEGLPAGPFDAEADATLEQGLRLLVRDQTGLSLDYAEQLYTFGDKYRDPREHAGRPRHVSVGYVALVSGGSLSDGGDAAWRDWYAFFPWEDWRRGKPKSIDTAIVPRLESWVAAGEQGEQEERRERVATTFGLTGAGWDMVRVLERYELLYEADCIGEALRDEAARAGGRGAAKSGGDHPPSADARAFGRPMIRDHRRILATAMSRIRGKITYRPVVFDLLPHIFTLFQLQKTVEAISGTGLHKQNFRRMVINGKLVEPTGEFEQGGAGRPAELYRFRPDVMGEQLAPGVGKFGGR